MTAGYREDERPAGLYAAECRCGWLIGGPWVRVAQASIAHQRSLGHAVQQMWPAPEARPRTTPRFPLVTFCQLCRSEQPSPDGRLCRWCDGPHAYKRTKGIA